MLKIENVVTPSPEQWRSVIMGARNAMNSWEKSDSLFGFGTVLCNDCPNSDKNPCGQNCLDIGPNDHDLMKRLRNAGTDHRKFMRMITVYVDITAPLYWWKEFDTYKVGTVANSCSTMHKIHAKEFTLEDFSCEHLIKVSDSEFKDEVFFEDSYHIRSRMIAINGLEFIIEMLNHYQKLYLETKDKKYWWQMIQLLPSSYNQKRTVMLNYEVLANIYKSRKDHRLDEWRDFCGWIESLSYSELITKKEGE